MTQTAIGPIPHNQVLIDAAIPLIPVPDSAYTPEMLTVRLETIGVVDFYLKGTHHLTVVDGPHHHTVSLRFGDPSPPDRPLSPKLETIEVIAQGNPLLKDFPMEEGDDLLFVTGSGFPLDYHRAWIQVDGFQAYLHGTQILQDADRAFIHLPDGFHRRPGANELTFATPFGAAWATF